MQPGADLGAGQLKRLLSLLGDPGAFHYESKIHATVHCHAVDHVVVFFDEGNLPVGHVSLSLSCRTVQARPTLQSIPREGEDFVPTDAALSFLRELDDALDVEGVRLQARAASTRTCPVRSACAPVASVDAWRPTLRVSPQVLVADFEADYCAAWARYSNRVLDVEGPLADRREVVSNPDEIAVGDPATGLVRCYVMYISPEIKALRIGQRVRVRGEVGTLIHAKDGCVQEVTLGDCGWGSPHPVPLPASR